MALPLTFRWFVRFATSPRGNEFKSIDKCSSVVNTITSYFMPSAKQLSKLKWLPSSFTDMCQSNLVLLNVDIRYVLCHELTIWVAQTNACKKSLVRVFRQTRIDFHLLQNNIYTHESYFIRTASSVNPSWIELDPYILDRGVIDEIAVYIRNGKLSWKPNGSI